MILILTDELEPTSDLVIDWIIKLNKPFVRISSLHTITIEEIYHAPENYSLEAIFSFERDGERISIDTKDITSYWYRRSVLGWKHIEIEYAPSPTIQNAINEYRLVEKKSLIQTLNYILNKKAKLNRFGDSDILKIKALDVAINVGLKVPFTFITKKRDRLKAFVDQQQSAIITKPIGDPLSFFDIEMHQYTSLVDPDKLPETFDYSQVQTAIDKNFELRIFYFDNTFYASAVFSQEDERTKIDLKNYDIDNPNRVLPYQLPIETEDKLRKLMNILDLDSGSIDMICNKQDELIFLEVNPIGQFEQVSNPCNYNLYNKVASYL